MKPNYVRQVLFPILAALIWGTAFAAQSMCAEHIPPFAFNAARSYIAVAFLLPLSLLMDRHGRKAGLPYPKADRRALVLGGICTGVILAAASNLQQAGIADTSAGKAGFITASYVVLVPVAGIFLRRRVPLHVWVSVVLAAIGLWMLCIKSGEAVSLETADVFLMLCAVFYCAQIYCIDYFVRKVDGIRLSCAQFLVAGIISTALSLLFERFDPAAFLDCILPLLYVGVMSSGVAYTLQILAQKGSNPTVVTILFSLESVFSVIAGAVVLHQALTEREYLGCLVMFAAVILAQIPVPVLRKAVGKRKNNHLHS